MKVFLFLLCAISAQLFISCGGDNASTKEQKDTTANQASEMMSDDAMIKRGEYLVKAIGGCADCHCPKKFTAQGPVPDMDLWLSGHPASSKLPPAQPGASKAGWLLFSPDLTAFVGPWGTSFAANLTPDTATGIGAWTESTFFTTIQQGKYHGAAAGRDLLPPMPWQAFRNMNEDDLRAIFTYLKSIRPINNAVPAPIPPQGS